LFHSGDGSQSETLLRGTTRTLEEHGVELGVRVGPGRDFTPKYLSHKVTMVVTRDTRSRPCRIITAVCEYDRLRVRYRSTS
jgi:hypothetical protein